MVDMYAEAADTIVNADRAGANAGMAVDRAKALVG